MKLAPFFLLALILQTTPLCAQYNSGYGGGYRNNGMPQAAPTKPSAEQLEKAKNERTDKIMSTLKKELNLDDLQFIAIQNEIVSSSKSIDILMKSKNSDEEKENEIKAIQEKSEKNIKSYLSPDQKEKYIALVSGKKGKKAKNETPKTEE